VEALNTPTIRRLTPSCRHQLSALAPQQTKKMTMIKRLKAAGKETQGEIARSYNVSRWTIARLAP
jgi:DNA-binding transcriptional regulator LsrR (DeoR family)